MNGPALTIANLAVWGLGLALGFAAVLGIASLATTILTGALVS